MQTLQQLSSGDLIGTIHLKLSCGLTAFPQEIFILADTLEILDLSGNQLSELPDDFYRLKNLSIVFFSDNHFTIFPEVLGKCKKLDIIGFKANKIAVMSETALPANTRWLILTNNKLAALPKSIGNCLRMQKLMLAGNHLQTLPKELANCKKLGLLRISANRITEFPDWLVSMPRLSWLAFSGNPFSAKMLAVNELVEIIWEELEIAHQLGEGASGIIAMAKWENELLHKEPKNVAVKIFKGEVTSDGLPADEMNASMAVGVHPNIVEVLGKIHQHPLQKQGLVLKLIPPGYKNLGGPPSFETCTRDVFAKGTSFSLSTIIKISLDIASAAAHLHVRGIMHGDLYAHNILVDDAAHALFGDFGAATIYKGIELETAAALEKLEVSAFGYLLEDLLTNVSAEEKESLMIGKLYDLQKACVQPNVLERPDFKTVFEVIAGLV